MVVLSHWGKNKLQVQKGPTWSSHYNRNDRTIWQNMMTIKKWAGRNVKSSIKGSPTPEVGRELWISPWKGMKKSSRPCKQASRPRQTHERQVDLGHTWRESTREAYTPPACTQPIWDLVGSWVRGKGVWFGRGKKGRDLFCSSYPSSFGRYILLGWQTTQKRQGWGRNY